MAYIEFRGICKSYDGVNQVLKNIDLDVEKGELVTFVGTKWLWKINASTFISWT